jgi:hypothetical protein
VLEPDVGIVAGVEELGGHLREARFGGHRGRHSRRGMRGAGSRADRE